MVLEVSDIPDSGSGESRGGIKGEAALVPGKFEGIENVVEHADGGEGFVWVMREMYRKCKDT